MFIKVCSKIILLLNNVQLLEYIIFKDESEQKYFINFENDKLCLYTIFVLFIPFNLREEVILLTQMNMQRKHKEKTKWKISLGILL